MADPAPQLSPADRRALRARAHPLQPVVIVGAKGLGDAVLKEAEIALKSHELIKVKLTSDDREMRASQFAALIAALSAAPVQQIGKIVTLYRARIEAPEPPKPAPKRHPARRVAPAPRSGGQDRRAPATAKPKHSSGHRAPVRRGGRPGGSAPARRPRSRA